MFSGNLIPHFDVLFPYSFSLVAFCYLQVYWISVPEINVEPYTSEAAVMVRSLWVPGYFIRCSNQPKGKSRILMNLYKPAFPLIGIPSILAVSLNIYYNSLVSAVSRLRAGRPGSACWQGKETFLLPTSSRQTSVVRQSTAQWVPETFILGVRWTGSEADHSPPTTAKNQREWRCTPTP
jgi:hypothetical protein